MAAPRQKRSIAFPAKKQSSNAISISLIGIFFKNFLQFFILFLDLHFDLFYLRCTLHLSSFGNQIFFIWQAVSFSAAITFCLVHYFLTLFCIRLLLKIKKESCHLRHLSYTITHFYVFRVHLIHPNRPLSRGFFQVEKHPLLLYP